MSAAWLLDAALALMVPVLAALALAHPRLIAGILIFIVYGLALTVCWYRLGAPDVALAEAAVGAGITGALLIGAAARLQRIERRRKSPS